MVATESYIRSNGEALYILLVCSDVFLRNSFGRYVFCLL
jgi:hypothetical protein